MLAAGNAQTAEQTALTLQQRGSASHRLHSGHTRNPSSALAKDWKFGREPQGCTESSAVPRVETLECRIRASPVWSQLMSQRRASSFQHLVVVSFGCGHRTAAAISGADSLNARALLAIAAPQACRASRRDPHHRMLPTPFLSLSRARARADVHHWH